MSKQLKYYNKRTGYERLIGLDEFVSAKIEDMNSGQQNELLSKLVLNMYNAGIINDASLLNMIGEYYGEIVENDSTNSGD